MQGLSLNSTYSMYISLQVRLRLLLIRLLILLLAASSSSVLLLPLLFDPHPLPPSSAQSPASSSSFSSSFSSSSSSSSGSIPGLILLLHHPSPDSAIIPRLNCGLISLCFFFYCLYCIYWCLDYDFSFFPLDKRANSFHI